MAPRADPIHKFGANILTLFSKQDHFTAIGKNTEY